MAGDTKKRTRKKAVESVSAPEALPSTETSSETPPTGRVSLNDLWAMRLAKADQRTAEVEKKLAQAKAEAARMARLYALLKLDPKGIVLGIEKQRSDAEAAEKAAEKAIEKAENAALIAKKRMEASLGRPMQGVAIDPDTGEVLNHQ